MISKITLYLPIAVIFLLWLPSPLNAELSNFSRLFLSAGIWIILPIAWWIDTILKFGLRSLRTVPLFLQIFTKSKKAKILLFIIGVCLVLWWFPTPNPPAPHRLEMTIILLLTIFLLWTQPISAIVLSDSSSQSHHVLSNTAKCLFPYRIVSLIRASIMGTAWGPFSWFTDDFRIDSDKSWREVVNDLTGSVPLIVVDTRTRSQFVKEEISEICRDESILSKTIFIVGDNNYAPAFPQLNSLIKQRKLNLTHESELKSNLDLFRKS